MKTLSVIKSPFWGRNQSPLWGQGIRSIWLRNFLSFRYSFGVTVSWIILEPLLSLIAIGYGIGNYIAAIEGKAFIDFYFPGLISVTAFTIPFFENTYGVFSKWTHQKTYQNILMTPINPSEVFWAEVLWASSKGILSCFAISVIARMLGIYHSWLIVPAFLILLILTVLGATTGLIFATLSRNFSDFNYAISGFLLPMCFLSDTYFPIQPLHWAIKSIVQLFPLIHGTRAVRFVMGTGHDSDFIVAVLALPLFTIGLTFWSFRRFRAKLLSL